MADIPGMYPMGNDQFGHELYGVRGFISAGPFATMTLMINGVMQKDFLDTPTKLMNVPVASIDRVEVVRGPMSVIYGSGAFFGAVNIITDDRYNDDPVRMVSVSAGNRNTYKGFARHGAREGDWSYILNAGYEKDDGPLVPWSDMASKIVPITGDYHTFYQRPDGSWARNSGDTGSRLGTENLDASLFTSYKGLTCDMRMLKLEHQDYFSIVTDKPLKPNGAQSSTVQLGYETAVTPWLSLSGKAKHQDYSFTQRPNWYQEYYISVHQIDFKSLETEISALLTPVTDLTILAGVNRNTMDDFQLSFDTPFAQSLQNANMFAEPITTWGIFTQADWKATDRLRVIGGIRFERGEDYNLKWTWTPETPSGEYPYMPTVLDGSYSQDKDWEIIPRLALLYDISSRHILKLMYGTAVKRPSPWSVAFRTFENGEVLPETMTTYELNYIGILASNLTANVSVFRNEAEQLICFSSLYDPNTQNWTSLTTNTGEMITHGIEMSVQVKPVRQLMLNAGLVIQKTEDKRLGWENIEPWGSPRFLGYFKASYEFPKNITLGATVRYVDDMLAEWSPDAYQNGVPTAAADDPKQGRYGYPVDAYWLVALNLRADKLFNTGFFASANIYNLPDEKIMYPVNSSINDNWGIDKGTPDFGRRFLVTVGYEW